MDKQEAQFILQSFRPDGADAADTDFAAALKLAAENRELGKWLADERAADAAFAAALCEVEIPEDLRQHILAMMKGDRPEAMALNDTLDHMFHDAMDEVEPPANLREQILTAMSIGAGSTEAKDSQRSKAEEKVIPVVYPSWGGWFSSWGRAAAVAAAVLLGGILAVQVTKNPVGHDGMMAPHELQHHAANLLNVGHEWEVREADSQSLNHWLVSHELPTPASVPRSLRSMDGMDCKMLRLPGDRKASLICFKGDGLGKLYLMITRNVYVRDNDELPQLTEVTTRDCYHCPATKWNAVRWRDANNTYILLSKKEKSRKDELLRFF